MHLLSASVPSNCATFTRPPLNTSDHTQFWNKTKLHLFFFLQLVCIFRNCIDPPQATKPVSAWTTGSPLRHFRTCPSLQPHCDTNHKSTHTHWRHPVFFLHNGEEWGDSGGSWEGKGKSRAEGQSQTLPLLIDNLYFLSPSPHFSILCIHGQHGLGLQSSPYLLSKAGMSQKP